MDIRIAVIVVVIFAILAIWTLRSGKAKASLKFLKTKMEFERSDKEEQIQSSTSNNLEVSANSTAKNVKQVIVTPQASNSKNIASVKDKSKVDGVDQQIKGN